jgi:hypothetical protein
MPASTLVAIATIALTTLAPAAAFTSAAPATRAEQLAAPIGLAAAPTGLAGGAPNDVFVEVNPSTIEAGNRVGVRASCPDNNKPATVRSDVFGRVTVEPRFDFLTASVMVPDNQDPRSFTVRLTCPEGETATATLHVVGRTRPSRGPATGFGGTVGDDPGGLLIGAGLLAIAGGVALGLLTLRRRRAIG